MKILTIASILPIPGLLDENNYVINHINNHQRRFPEDKFVIIKPVGVLPKLVVKTLGLNKKWDSRNIAGRIPFYLIENFKIIVYRYFSIGRISFLNALLSKSIIFFNRKNIKTLLALQSSISLTKESGVRLIHAHYLFPDGLLGLYLSKKMNVPYILTLQNEVRFFKNYFSRKAAFKIINSAKYVSTLSPIMSHKLSNYGYKNIKLLALGINNNFFRSAEEIQNKRTNQNLETLRLVSVCNLVPIKNIAMVIKALSGIDLDKFNYTIYGKGPLEKELRELVITLGLEKNIDFKGSVNNEDLPELLPQYDLFVQPSFKETFGLSYFEALACGLPVVLTENTGAWHFIKEFNVAFAVNPGEVNSMRDCLEKIISSRKILVEKSKNCLEAAKIASWNNYVNYFHEAYNNLNDGV